jgi:hypothetical protein
MRVVSRKLGRAVCMLLYCTFCRGPRLMRPWSAATRKISLTHVFVVSCQPRVDRGPGDGSYIFFVARPFKYLL